MTIDDLAWYPTKKEAWVRGDRAVTAAGEEDLMVFYLSDIDVNERHTFVVPQPAHPALTAWRHVLRLSDPLAPEGVGYEDFTRVGQPRRL